MNGVTVGFPDASIYSVWSGLPVLGSFTSIYSVWSGLQVLGYLTGIYSESVWSGDSGLPVPTCSLGSLTSIYSVWSSRLVDRYQFGVVTDSSGRSTAGSRLRVVDHIYSVWSGLPILLVKLTVTGIRVYSSSVTQSGLPVLGLLTGIYSVWSSRLVDRYLFGHGPRCRHSDSSGLPVLGSDSSESLTGIYSSSADGSKLVQVDRYQFGMIRSTLRFSEPGSFKFSHGHSDRYLFRVGVVRPTGSSLGSGAASRLTSISHLNI